MRMSYVHALTEGCDCAGKPFGDLLTLECIIKRNESQQLRTNTAMDLFFC